MYTLLAQINKHEQEKAQIAELTKTIQDYINNDQSALRILLDALRFKLTGFEQYQSHYIILAAESSSKFSNPTYFSFTINIGDKEVLFEAIFDHEGQADLNFTVEIKTYKAESLTKPVIDYLNDVLGLNDTPTTN